MEEERGVNARSAWIKTVMERPLLAIKEGNEEKDKKLKGWWDEEFTRSKEVLREWRKGRMHKADYNRKHREHGKLINRKRE